MGDRMNLGPLEAAIYQRYSVSGISITAALGSAGVFLCIL
jgi:hypothetical protein